MTARLHILVGTEPVNREVVYSIQSSWIEQTRTTMLNLDDALIGKNKFVYLAVQS